MLVIGSDDDPIVLPDDVGPFLGHATLQPHCTALPDALFVSDFAQIDDTADYHGLSDEDLCLLPPPSGGHWPQAGVDQAIIDWITVRF